MFKNLLQLYSLLSCLIYAIICLISGAFLLNDVTLFAFPDLMYSYYYPSHLKTNHDFIQAHKDRHDIYEDLVKKTDKEITEMRLLEREDLRLQQKEDSARNTKRSILFKSQWFLLSLIFFGLHWRLYRKSLVKQSENQ